MAGQQQEEIETIRSRTIEVKLSDADVKRISEKAAAHGLTVGELIENFIGDLVCGTYSNGSDERMYAEQWFERCWFGMFPDLTFLRYLIEWGGLDEVIGAWENIKSTEENIQTSEEELASGVMKGRGGETYTWKDITNGEGTPIYSSKEEWEQEERTVIADWREEVEADKQTLAEYPIIMTAERAILTSFLKGCLIISNTSLSVKFQTIINLQIYFNTLYIKCH